MQHAKQIAIQTVKYHRQQRRQQHKSAAPINTMSHNRLTAGRRDRASRGNMTGPDGEGFAQPLIKQHQPKGSRSSGSAPASPRGRVVVEIKGPGKSPVRWWLPVGRPQRRRLPSWAAYGQPPSNWRFAGRLVDLRRAIGWHDQASTRAGAAVFGWQPSPSKTDHIKTGATNITTGVLTSTLTGGAFAAADSCAISRALLTGAEGIAMTSDHAAVRRQRLLFGPSMTDADLAMPTSCDTPALPAVITGMNAVDIVFTSALMAIPAEDAGNRAISALSAPCAGR